MTVALISGMADATAMTRSGKLQEATTLIQSLLEPAAQEADRPSADQDVAGVMIEGDFTRLMPKAPMPETAPSRAKPWRPSFGAPRTPLGETLRMIVAGRMPTHGPKLGAMIAMPRGAQFLSLSHTAPQGSRSYRLYIPSERPQKPMPLIVMLHGCTQTPEDFAAGTGMNALAEEFGCLIAYPAQPSGANVQKCWNWYRPEDQARDRGEPALIAGLTRDILRDHPVDSARTYIAGLSAGGAAAVVIAAAYPDIFSAAGVHSGLPAGGAHDIPSAFAAMRRGTKSKPHQIIVPTIVFHGLADRTVHPKNGTAILSQAVHAMPAMSVTSQHGTTDGGRFFRTTAHLHADGRSLAELWEIEGAGHAWAGGNPAGSYTDPLGPDASRQMTRFFLQLKKA